MANIHLLSIHNHFKTRKVIQSKTNKFGLHTYSHSGKRCALSKKREKHGATKSKEGKGHRPLRNGKRGGKVMDAQGADVDGESEN